VALQGHLGVEGAVAATMAAWEPAAGKGLTGLLELCKEQLHLLLYGLLGHIHLLHLMLMPHCLQTAAGLESSGMQGWVVWVARDKWGEPEGKRGKVQNSDHPG